MAGSLQNLDPSMTQTYEQGEVFGAIFETLTRAAEGARIIPWLASSFHAEEGGKKFRFRLQDGVRFHDGRRLTARDVRYSFERLLQNRESASRSLLAPIRGANRVLNGDSGELEGFRILSSLEFTIELEQALSFFPAILAYTPASIIPEGSREIGRHWREGCVGTGPFRVTSFEPDRRLRLEPNPSYRRTGYPRSEGLEFAFRTSPSDILSGFRNGRYSMAWNLFPSDVESLRHEWEFAAKYREIPSLSTYFIAFNIHKGPLVDEDFRRRIVQEIDVDGLIQRNLGRLAVPARTLVPPALLGYEPGSSVRQVSTSEPLRKELELQVGLHPTFEGLHAPVTEEITGALKRAGFRLRTISTGAGFLDQETIAAGDLVMLRWYADYPDADTFINGLLHSKMGLIGKLCGSPEVDHLIEQGRTETDPTGRHDINRQIEALIQKHYLLLPLFHEQAYCFGSPEVEGLELNFFSPMVPYEKLFIRR
jgi:oligopeptide transport system substrate-binding protein